MNRALIAGLAAAVLLAAPAVAQQSPPQPDLRAQIQAAREMIDKERRIILASEMNLSSEERDGFWSLYNEYARELSAVNDIRVDVILRFARHYRSMTDEVASGLIKDRFRHERELLKLRERYLKRFRRILPETKVARFFQVDANMETALDYNLVQRVPVIQDPPRQP